MDNFRINNNNRINLYDRIELDGNSDFKYSQRNYLGRLFRWIGDKAGLNTENNRAVMEKYQLRLFNDYGKGGIRAYDEILSSRHQQGEPLSQHEFRETDERAQFYSECLYEPEFDIKPARLRNLDGSYKAGGDVKKCKINDTVAYVFHPTIKELDDLVAEQQLNVFSDPEVTPQLQARLDIFKAALDEAYRMAKNDNKLRIFMAPEWMFRGVSPNGMLTEGEMRALVKELVNISADYTEPEMLICAGSILWNRPNPPIFDGPEKLETDMLFNVMPIVAGGKLVHINYKQNDGGDVPSQMTVVPPDEKYRDTKNRVQLFLHHSDISRTGQQIREQTMDYIEQARHDASPNSESREWENELYGEGRLPSPFNHLFEYGGRYYAIDICRDHGEGQARRELGGAYSIYIMAKCMELASNTEGGIGDQFDDAIRHLMALSESGRDHKDLGNFLPGENVRDLGFTSLKKTDSLYRMPLALLTKAKNIALGLDDKLSSEEKAEHIAKELLAEIIRSRSQREYESMLIGGLPDQYIKNAIENAVLVMLGEANPYSNFLMNENGTLIDGMDVHLHPAAGAGRNPGGLASYRGGLFVYCDAATGVGELVQT